MNLGTRYLGLNLAHPFVLGASPLGHELDTIRRAEDAGAAAVVLHSLFEEQILLENGFIEQVMGRHELSHAEASDYFPSSDEFALSSEEYLEHISKVKKHVSIPVIASLNGVTNHGWLEYATLCEQAGADALELNVYQLATNATDTSEAIEQRTLEMVKTVRGRTGLPLAVKLSPFYTSLCHFAHRLEDAGANGLVLFNRFYQPDIDPEALDVRSKLELSNSSELLLRLRWLAVLSPMVRGSLAVTGGVHTGIDAIKALMAGAHAVQVVSEVLMRGPERFGELVSELRVWLEQHEYGSVSQLQGSMNLERCPDTGGYERANYMRMLRSYNRAG
ncbi:MAG TPA: dihydroorotate dehydrogenase-like protein [Polyangiaceae bacterium]|nr:dihydroorotate dehydrogenase-like protein [Polyangiaceae bacterium]